MNDNHGPDGRFISVGSSTIEVKKSDFTHMGRGAIGISSTELSNRINDVAIHEKLSRSQADAIRAVVMSHGRKLLNGE